jgi:GNAT superfamily N-acetyltransferase
MKTRTIDVTDGPAILELWNHSVIHDRLTLSLLEEKIWRDRDLDGDLALLTEVAGRTAAMAVGVVRRLPDGERRGYVKLIAVRPDLQLQGLGTRLLETIHERIAERGAETIRLGESTPNYLIPGLDVRYTRARVFFEEAGYRHFGETFNLDTPLTWAGTDTTAAEARHADRGLDVRRAVDSDRSAVTQLLERHWLAWTPEVSVAFDNRPVSLHVALSEGQIVAFSAYDTNNLGTGWFGPMGTDPEFRGSGVGGTLLKRCLRDILEQGIASAIIPWVGPIGFYHKQVGATISRTFHRYEKSLE